MPLDITFTLSDQDLDHFQKIVDKAKTATESGESNASIEAAARQLIVDAKSSDLPEFISSRLSKLEVVISMVSDEEWQLSEGERNRVVGALAYFCDPEDLIPDHVPGLGFLDDIVKGIEYQQGVRQGFNGGGRGFVVVETCDQRFDVIATEHGAKYFYRLDLID